MTTTEPRAATPESVVAYFQKHLVPIHLSFRKAGAREHRSVVTTFVLEVLDSWFLATAGHCLNDIESNLAEGYSVHCHLMDGLGRGASHDQPIPFEYVQEVMFAIDEQGVDLGLIPLSPVYRRLLQANGVQALNEQVWKHQPDRVDFFRLFGLPQQLIRHERGQVIATTVMLKVEALSRKPRQLQKVPARCFYGRVDLSEKLTDLSGFSGGPILAFQDGPAGMRYWLHAVQSRWIPTAGKRHGLIAACYTTPLGELVERTMREILAGTATTLGDRDG